jgi:large subunit ribosomal protein L15
MQLNELRDNPGANKARKRVGRGIGSGKGKTAGHGHKGQKARTGVAIKGFEGGQMPLQRRLPKRGFVHLKDPVNMLNLVDLQKAVERKLLDPSKMIDAEILFTLGLIKKMQWPLRILGKGILKEKIQITADYFSAGALAAIEKLGGKAVLIEKKVIVSKKPARAEKN